MKYHPAVFSEISQGVPGCLYRWMSSVVHAAPVSTIHCVALLVATVSAVTVAASPRLSTQSPSQPPSQPPSQSPLLVAVCGGGCGGTASGCSRRWACLGTVSAVATVAAPVTVPLLQFQEHTHSPWGCNTLYIRAENFLDTRTTTRGVYSFRLSRGRSEFCSLSSLHFGHLIPGTSFSPTHPPLLRVQLGERARRFTSGTSGVTTSIRTTRIATHLSPSHPLTRRTNEQIPSRETIIPSRSPL